jgi:hypothetical protein
LSATEVEYSKELRAISSLLIAAEGRLEDVVSVVVALGSRTGLHTHVPLVASARRAFCHRPCLTEPFDVSEEPSLECAIRYDNFDVPSGTSDSGQLALQRLPYLGGKIAGLRIAALQINAHDNLAIVRLQEGNIGRDAPCHLIWWRGRTNALHHSRPVDRSTSGDQIGQVAQSERLGPTLQD